PSGTSRPLVPGMDPVRDRAAFGGRGWAASGMVWGAMGVMNLIQHGPEHIAVKLKRAHGLALKLGRVAMLKRDGQRLVRIMLRLCSTATEVIQALWVDPRIEFFEG